MSLAYLIQGLAQSNLILSDSEGAEFIGKPFGLKTFYFLKISDCYALFVIHLSSCGLLLPATTMGRRAKHHTVADKALAAKAYNKTYNRSPL